jgi:hypothetical protein
MNRTVVSVASFASFASVVVAAFGALAPLSSCATARGDAAGGSARFVDVAQLVATSTIPADAPAVVLLREQVIHVRGVRGVTAPVTEFRTHEVVKILTEAGFEAARQSVVIPPDGELVELAARTITPDGRVVPVDVKTMQRTQTIVEGSAGAEIRFFQFPRVEVGSVLELVTTTRTSGLFLSWSDTVSSPFPIAHYRADVSTPTNVKFDFLLNGTTTALQQVPDAEGRQRVVFELKDVPPLVDEIWAPSEHTGAPWWIYRITELRSARGGEEPGIVAWDRAVPFSLYGYAAENEPVAGLSRLDAGDCKGDVRCLTDRALERVRGKELSNFAEQMEVREPAEMEQSVTLNSVEKSLWLWSLLKSVDVPAQLAVLSRAPGFPVNKTFPAPAWFDHAVVVVPMPGGAGSWFLDPSCEACSAGQLPEWDRGVEALVITSRGNHFQLDTAWVPVTGTPLPANEHRVAYDAVVADSGDVEVTVDDTVVGEAAMLTRLMTREDTDADTTHEWEHFATARSASAHLLSSTSWSCDRAKGSCARKAKIALPGYAQPDGDRLVMPLRLLHSRIEDEIPPETDAALRKDDIEIGHEVRWTETLRVHAPTGWAFAEPPPRVDRKSDVGTVRMTARVGDDGVLIVERGVVVPAASLAKRSFGSFVRMVGALSAARDEQVTLAKAQSATQATTAR